MPPLGPIVALITAFEGWVDRHRDEIAAALRWIEEHQKELQMLGVWGQVQRACKDTGLYAPLAPVWGEIAEAARRGDDAESLATFILSAYGPGGDAHGILQQELRSARLLQNRAREVDEVLESLGDSRHYVTICGALPLVEGVLAAAHGKWKKHLDDYPLEDKLDGYGMLTADEEAELILNASAIGMVFEAVNTTWKGGGHRQVGAVMSDLNRNRALHGTTIGWDTRENAIRAVLLLAAAARIAGPLLQPSPSKATSPS